MKKSFIDELIETKKRYQKATVNFYNDGSISTDDYSTFERSKLIGTWENNYAVRNLKMGAVIYAEHYDFDSIRMKILMGLIYNIKDVDADNNIKEGAKPINNIVRYYTGDVDCFLNGKQTSDESLHKSIIGHQSYLNYNEFVNNLKELGLDYNGPKTFEEFRDMILSSSTFDLFIDANLKEKTEENKLIKKL